MLVKDRANIVHILREIGNIATVSVGTAMASKIHGGDLQSVIGQEARERIVAAAVLAEAVEQEQRLLRRCEPPATKPEMNPIGDRPRSLFSARLIRHVAATAGTAA